MEMAKSLSRSLRFEVRLCGLCYGLSGYFGERSLDSFYYADGARCGKTIVDLFAKAKDPDKVIVGIVDQSAENDMFCLEAYCKEMGKFSVCGRTEERWLL
jgi:Glycosyltransferase (GlcNAc)